jgi:predicted HTH domain antitoxin
MNVELSVADELAEALRAEGRSVEAQIRVVLAIACYERGLISVGKAAEVSGLTRGEFETELSRRKVVQPYALEDVEADVKWAKSLVASNSK